MENPWVEVDRIEYTRLTDQWQFQMMAKVLAKIGTARLCVATIFLTMIQRKRRIGAL